MRAKAWDEEDLIGHAGAKGECVGGFSRADNCADVGEVLCAHGCGAECANFVGHEFGDGAAVGEKAGLNGVGAGVAGADENEDA